MPALTCVGHDLYKKDNMDDLQKFYDYFAKGIDNGWLETPRLRLTLLAMVGSVVPSVVERPEEISTFPLPRARYRKLFLDTTRMTLEPTKPIEETCVTYEGHSLTDQIVSMSDSLASYTVH